MDYQPDGSIRFCGFALVKVEKRYLVNFPEGARVYIKRKAKMGALESVVIKRINRSVPQQYSYRGIDAVVSYVDTFNRVWIEEELVSADEAIDYAKLHWRRAKQDAEALLREQGFCA
jgi:hypothetical protein